MINIKVEKETVLSEHTGGQLMYTVASLNSM